MFKDFACATWQCPRKRRLCEQYTYHSRNTRTFFSSVHGSRLKLHSVNSLKNSSSPFAQRRQRRIHSNIHFHQTQHIHHKTQQFPFSHTDHKVNFHKHLCCTLDRAAVLPSTVRSQAMSPTTLCKTSVRRTRLRTQRQEERVFCSPYNSVAEVTTTLSLAGFDDPRVGSLASHRCSSKKDKQVSPFAGVCHSR